VSTKCINVPRSQNAKQSHDITIIPCSTALIEKLTVTQLVKKFLAFIQPEI